jgi:hypothetical protein
MKRMITALLTTILSFSVMVGCGDEKPLEEGLKITGISSSLGGVNGNRNSQEFSYAITVENISKETIDIEWLEPAIVENIKSKMAEPTQLRKQIGRELKMGESALVDGKITFDATNMTKEEILRLEIIFGVSAKVEKQEVFIKK